MKTEFDVIVVGGGGSGLAAAVSAAEHGAQVLLLEKMPQLGGTTGIAIGSFSANRTIYQKRAGIVDNPNDHEADAGKFATTELQQRNNSSLRRFFLENGADTMEWLLAMGIRFHGPSPEPPNRVPRMHNVVPNAKAYIATLQSQLLRRGGRIVCNAPVQEVVKQNGGVTGVVALVEQRRTTFYAKRGVVLAAGDYASSPEMIAQYKGAEYAVVEGINPNATGDGQRLAEQAGAQLVNMDVTYGPELRFLAPQRKPFSQLLPGNGILASLMGRMLPLVPNFIINIMVKRLLVTWQHPENSLFDDGAILVNSQGQRFCDEKSTPGREIGIASQPDKLAYILLDRRLISRYSQWPNFISTAPEIAYAYVADYRRIRPDVTALGSTLDSIAKARQLPAEKLRATIDQFNRFARGDSTDPRGRSDRPTPLEDGSWCLLGPVKAYFSMTEGSPRVNQRLEVLDPQGQAIPGLYAVGQNGIGGQILWGHGLHIGWALTSGRLAGRLVAKRREASDGCRIDQAEGGGTQICVTTQPDAMISDPKN